MTRSPSPDLQVSGLSHSYGADPVLSNVDLTVAGGETLTLLGPSGCGKTTLLRAIAGLERAESGTVTMGDRVVSGPQDWVAPERRQVGMVFQEWALFPHLSVSDNVSYGLARSDRGGAKVQDALAMVGLAELGDRMPHTLSGGQQQRVALARALAPRPQLLLLDEPFSNLDSSLRVEVRTEVHRLLHELEITAVFVTHDQEEAFVLGDEVAVMHGGEVRQVGSPQQIYHQPADRWVAEFVGSVSVLAGEAVDGAVSTAIGRVPIGCDSTGPVEIVLRPEHLALVEGDTAVVELVEFYGHDAMVFVEAAGSRLQVRTGPHVAVRRGQRVGVQFVGERATAFPAG